MFEEASTSRKKIAEECKRLAAAIRKTDSDKLKKDYGKRLKYLQKRLLYAND